MCLAIFKPIGLNIPEKNLRCGYEGNSDGCGIAWAEDNKLTVTKGMMKWDDFWKLYQEHQNCPMLIHFRKSTHGKKDEANCHPFLFNDGNLALIHNGVLPIKCSEDGYSDTWHLVNKVLDPLVKNHGIAIDDPALSWLIQIAIGTDKIVVMDANGEAIIFNEEKGNWEPTDGAGDKKGQVWYSNTSFRNETWRNRQTSCSGTPDWRPGTGSINPHASNRDQSDLPVIGDEAGADEAQNWEGYGYTGRMSQASGQLLGGSDTEIATDANRGPGKMTEYGWYDLEIENEIEGVKKKTGQQRDDAIIYVFNNA
jgi:hypothetical protein